jgi:hypothetical protein
MKTRRNRHSARRIHRRTGGGELPEHTATFHGLHHWHKHIFEKLGWMVLAKAKGHDDKIEQYKRGIMRFLETVDHVSSEYSNTDRKHDLNVLKMNMLELQEFVNKTF